MTRFRRAYPMLAIAVFALASCNGGDNPSPVDEQTVQLHGKYVGPVTAGGQTASMTLNTSQTNGNATGTYSIGAPINESGTMSGSFLGLVFNFTLTRTLPTPATFNSSVNLSGGADSLVGKFGNNLYSYSLTGQ